MIRKISQGVTAIAISSLLFACGDSTTSPDSQNNDIVSFETYDVLPECTSDREGDIVLVRSEGQKYKCYAGTWALLVSNGESGSADSSSTEPSGDGKPGLSSDSKQEEAANGQVTASSSSTMRSSSSVLPGEDGGPGLSSDSKQEEAANGQVTASSSSTMRSSSSVASSSSVSFPPIPGIRIGCASLTGSLMKWCGSLDGYRIDTGLDVGTETSGYWYVYADDADGGASTITWPVPLGNEYVDDAMDPVIDDCDGLCGTISLEKGSLTYDPYVGVGFNVGGVDESGAPAAVDASKWGGVCVFYEVDTPMTIEIGLGDVGDAEIEYDNPFVTLAKAPAGSAKCFAWNQFKQAGGGSVKITGEAAAAKIANLKFKIQATSGSIGHFNIKGVSSVM
ncbi:MAG: hypothetical protein MJY98_09270 [Fibrobacter sp.]|nr:hypothetical protein [Fibrobacter sp.]